MHLSTRAQCVTGGQLRNSIAQGLERGAGFIAFVCIYHLPACLLYFQDVISSLCNRDL